MTNEEKKEKMKMKAIANTLNSHTEIVEDHSDDIENEFIIKDEISYILSLISTNKITLLERKDANIFTKSIIKDDMKDNYIILNKFAKRLLKEYSNNELKKTGKKVFTGDEPVTGHDYAETNEILQSDLQRVSSNLEL